MPFRNSTTMSAGSLIHSRDSTLMTTHLSFMHRTMVAAPGVIRLRRFVAANFLPTKAEFASPRSPGDRNLVCRPGVETAAVVRAMDWYPTLATFAGIKVPQERVIDGRDISPLLKGETETVPFPGLKKSLNASVPTSKDMESPR